MHGDTTPELFSVVKNAASRAADHVQEHKAERDKAICKFYAGLSVPGQGVQRYRLSPCTFRKHEAFSGDFSDIRLLK
jgi:hypothetical protein